MPLYIKNILAAICYSSDRLSCCGWVYVVKRLVSRDMLPGGIQLAKAKKKEKAPSAYSQLYKNVPGSTPMTPIMTPPPVKKDN